MLAVVVENLGRGAAGAGRAHLPEIVGGGDADDLVVGQPRHLFPDLGRLIVGVVDGDEQLVFRQAELLGEQLPGVGDRLLLEVVTERKVAEHLEKRVVARGVADVVEVVVLAAGAHAFLRRGGTLVVAVFDPGEQVLELDHARVHEHQCRVIARHQGRAVDDTVVVFLEEAQEGGADIVQAGHLSRLVRAVIGASRAAAPV